MRKIFLLVLFIYFSPSAYNFICSQTTGKISGYITTSNNQEPLVGANVIIEPLQDGTSTDADGRFSLINISPGTYSVRAMMIGYETVVIQDVKVSVNRTQSLDIEMKEAMLEGQEVVIYATKLSSKKDQTGTVKNISSEDIAILPVEDLSGVINMQAGVVAGHFRGGRRDEVSYMIDGVAVNDVFGGVGAVSNLEKEAVKDLEIITGTFNAEYGQAMSGVVNAITKDGNNNIEGSFSTAISSYLTSNEYNNETVYIGLDPFGLNTNYDNKFQFSGPFLKDKIHYFINYRTQNNSGYLNGIRMFNVWDESDFYDQDSSNWYSENTGDSSFVPMNSGDFDSFLAKLSFRPTSKIRSSLMVNVNKSQSQGYSHGFKYNPDGRSMSEGLSRLYVLQVNHFISQKMFYELKLSSTINDNGSYVFEDYNQYEIVDKEGIYRGQYHYVGDTLYAYVNDKYLAGSSTGFTTGGQDKGHTKRSTVTNQIKFDLTWQVNNVHGLKSGFTSNSHNLKSEYHTIRNAYAGTADEALSYKPMFFGDSTVYADIYDVSPSEFSFYLQDKMEFKEMVVNVGLRYDHFDANTTYPSQRRNPANQSTYILQNLAGGDSLNSNGEVIYDDEKMSKNLKSNIASQISPRFGFAYQLGGVAVLHFSYGHFLQMPPMYSIYENHSGLIGPSDYSTVVGNANLGSDSLGLNAQKTVSYEIGLWQQLNRNIGLEVNLYYRDIYDLLSAATVSTYNQIEYGIYTNKDYGNVRGLEVKLDYSINDFSVYTNYTYQYTRGNADNPQQTFNRQGSSVDEVIRFIPMSWDQRNTFNTTVAYRTPIIGASITGYYNSGTPYTFSPQGESSLAFLNLYPNNDYKPSNYSVDCSGYINFPKIRGVSTSLNFSIYNLFDRYNEYGVSSETGRAYTAIVSETELATHRSTFNTYEDRYKDPSAFSAPRTFKVSLNAGF